MLSEAAQLYSDVFTPEVFVLLCSLLLVGYEWRGASDRSLAGLGGRLAVLGLAWGVGIAVYVGVPRVVGTVPEWGADATGSVGLGAGMVVLWAVWRVRTLGSLVPAYALLLVGVTVPHLLITPFWDISTHVLYAQVPAGYLFLVDDRFGPLLAVGVAMVVARPLAGAHTWPESIGGFVLALVALWAFDRVHAPTDRRRTAVPDSG